MTNIRAIFYAIATLACSASRAEIVQANLEGIINSSPIAALNGEKWALTLVFDTAASEAPFTAGNPNIAQFFNTGPVKVLRLLDFSVGDSGAFTIHLVNPVPTNQSDVRIDIDNFTSKTFFAHVDDDALLPAWNGLQLDNFFLGLSDTVPGGYADGTDHLPGPDPSITIAEFTGLAQVRIQIGSGTLIGTPTSFALSSIPEFSTGGLCAAGGLALLLLKRRRQPSRYPAG